MSQLPESPAAGWPDQGYDPSAHPQSGEALSANGAAQQYAHAQADPQQWQQDTQPDWGAQQQQQGYAEQGYAQAYQQQQGYPAQQQQQWAGQAEPTMVAPPQAAAASAEAGLPTEFDHLFRDSTPDSRRAIDRQKPAVGGAAPGYLNGVQPEAAQQAAAPEQAAAAQSAPYQQQQQPYQGAFPQQAEQPYQQEQYQQEQYQGAGFQTGQYAPAEYTQPGYGGEYNGAGVNNGGFDGGSGNWAGGRGRNKRPLIIGGAVALVAVIGIVIANSGGGGSGGTPATAGSASATAPKLSKQQQADQVYQLIQQSGQLRSDANTAVVDVNDCKNLTGSQGALTATAQKRQSQADNVAKLDVSGITNGAQLVAQLQQAWTASANYDNAYAQIAGDMASGSCKSTAVKKDSNYKTASQAAGTADTAKSAAAQLWNADVVPLEPQVTGGKL